LERATGSIHTVLVIEAPQLSLQQWERNQEGRRKSIRLTFELSRRSRPFGLRFVKNVARLGVQRQVAELVSARKATAPFVMGHALVYEYLAVLDECSPENIGAEVRQVGDAEPNSERAFNPILYGDGQGDVLEPELPAASFEACQSAGFDHSPTIAGLKDLGSL
jgi:hypothetical protein